MSIKIRALFIALCCLHSGISIAQTERISNIEAHLQALSNILPGLNQRVETSISNGSIQEFLKGLAATHNLNINTDPAITQRITGYFSNEPVINVLIYLASQYNIDYDFIGTIITAKPYKNPSDNIPKPPKILPIQYDTSTSLVSFDLTEDSLSSVAKKITDLSQRNIVVMPELSGKKVTGFIKDMLLQNALEKLALSNGFKISKTNDDVFILEGLKQNEEIIPNENGLPNANFSIKKSNTTGESITSINVNNSEIGLKQISLNVVNSPIKDVIKAIAAQAGINYFIYSDLVGNTTANINNMEFNKALNFILKGTSYTYSISDGTYLIGERKNEGLRGREIMKLKYRSVDSIVAVIPKEIRQNVEIQEFKELNSILLSGSEPQIFEIENFIKQIDKTVPMVMLEVILLDVKKSKTISTGLKIGVSDSVKTGGTLLGGTDYTFGAADINRFLSQIGLNNVFNIGRVSPKFYASIKALESNANIELRQTPKLSTLNGHTANLNIGSTRYYAVSTQNVLGSLNPQTIVTQQFYPVEASLSISVLPFVSGDEQVTMNIDVNISDFIGNSGINVPPPTSSSKFKSIIRVKNEEMIVLGGIERTEKSDEGSGTPFLSRIPVIKWLFSSREKTTGKTVSVVFIKPTIIF